MPEALCNLGVFHPVVHIYMNYELCDTCLRIHYLKQLGKELINFCGTI